MSNFRGFGPLTEPAHLLRKLRHDLSRMEQDLADPYPAFDFFVTAEHLLDWAYPDASGAHNKALRTQKRQDEPLLRVTSHLASGAKHFQVTAPHHTSVDSLRLRQGTFDARAFDQRTFDTERLFLTLQGDEAKALGQHISAINLARRVLVYWQQLLPDSEP
jgi:hypothetical protein